MLSTFAASSRKRPADRPEEDSSLRDATAKCDERHASRSCLLLCTKDGEEVTVEPDVVAECTMLQHAIENTQPGDRLRVPLPLVGSSALCTVLGLLRDNTAPLPETDEAVFAAAAAASYLDADALTTRLVKAIADEIRSCIFLGETVYDACTRLIRSEGAKGSARRICERFGLAPQSENERSCRDETSDGGEESCMDDADEAMSASDISSNGCASKDVSETATTDKTPSGVTLVQTTQVDDLDVRLGTVDLFEACLAELKEPELLAALGVNDMWREAGQRVNTRVAYQARHISLRSLIKRGASVETIRRRLEAEPQEASEAELGRRRDTYYGREYDEYSDGAGSDESHEAAGELQPRRLPLHCAVSHEEDAVVLAVLEAYPAAAAVSAPHENEGGCWGLPLIMALSAGASERVITALLQAHPAGATCSNRWGMPPLFMATSRAVGEAILKAVPAYWPNAVRDFEGRLPLAAAIHAGEPTTTLSTCPSLLPAPCVHPEGC